MNVSVNGSWLKDTRVPITRYIHWRFLQTAIRSILYELDREIITNIVQLVHEGLKGCHVQMQHIIDVCMPFQVNQSLTSTV